MLVIEVSPLPVLGGRRYEQEGGICILSVGSEGSVRRFLKAGHIGFEEVWHAGVKRSYG